MSGTNPSYWHRALPRFAALALFLVGSNVCEIGAAAGRVPMGCMTVGATAAHSATPPCHHAGAPSRGHRAPVAKSCCPAPLLAPSGTRSGDAAPAATLLAFAIPAAPLAQPLAPVWMGHAATPDGQPPTPLLSAPSAARAPPLA